MVSGFGGQSFEKREVWRIPEFVFNDRNGNGQYVVMNLLVAIVDDGTITAFNMVLSSLVFRGSSFEVFDTEQDKHIEIHPGHDRPVYCIPEIYNTNDGFEDLIAPKMEFKEDEILIKGISVFYENA